jgi:type II secretory pathway predicted ATPase ExeA
VLVAVVAILAQQQPVVLQLHIIFLELPTMHAAQLITAIVLELCRASRVNFQVAVGQVDQLLHVAIIILLAAMAHLDT